MQNVERQVDLALELIRKGQYQPGLAAINAALQQAPDNPDVLLAIGFLHQLQGKHIESEPYFRKVLEMCPSRPFVHARLGLIAQWKGLHDEALNHFRKALNFVPNPGPPGLIERRIHAPSKTSEMCHLSIIEILSGQLRFDEAERAISDALQYHPDSTAICQRAADSWIQAGKTGKAIEVLRRLLLMDPRSATSKEAMRKITLCGWIEEALSVSVPNAAQAYQEASHPPLVIAVVVWGDSYVQGFLDTYLRSLAAPGNGPALADHFDIRFAVITTERGRNQIQASDAEVRFSGVASFDYLLMSETMIDALTHAESADFIYQVYFTASHVAIAYAQAIGAAISFATPDAIVADGSYGWVGQITARGEVDGIFATGVGVIEESFFAALRNFTSPDGYTISVGAPDLMKIGVQYLHPSFAQRIVCPSNQDFSQINTTLFWWVEEGLAAHILHWHPIFISAERLRRYKKFRYVSIDGVLPQLLFPDQGDRALIHLATQPDEYRFLATDQRDRKTPTTGHSFDPAIYHHWYKTTLDLTDISRWMFRHRILFRGFTPGNIPPEDLCYSPDFIKEITGEEAIS